MCILKLYSPLVQLSGISDYGGVLATDALSFIYDGRCQQQALFVDILFSFDGRGLMSFLCCRLVRFIAFLRIGHRHVPFVHILYANNYSVHLLIERINYINIHQKLRKVIAINRSIKIFNVHVYFANAGRKQTEDIRTTEKHAHKTNF